MTNIGIELIENSIRNVPDFPKPGIQFKDISTLLSDPAAFGYAVEAMEECSEKLRYCKIAAAESRGFIFGSAIARDTRKPLVMVRKPGKLPGETVSQSYELEYGQDSMEVTKESFEKGDRVLLVDDLLATGGTLEAMANLVEKCGAEVAGIVVLIELDKLCGREILSKWNVESVVHF
jgi:adenine phosphoribosyltransferase